MSAITIQNIIDNNSTRDAQRIMRKAIEGNTPKHLQDLVVGAAKEPNLLVNSEGDCSRKLPSVTFNQILDRMGTRALAYTLTWYGDEDIDMVQQAMVALAKCFEYEPEIGEQMPNWPYRGHIHPDYSARIDNLLDVQVTHTDAASEADESEGFDDELLSIANMAAQRATNGRVADIKSLIVEIEELRKRPTQVAPTPVPVDASGDIPSGRPVRKNAQDVFDLRNPLLDFEITAYEWDGTNPLVPQVMPYFKFDVDALADLLWARETKKNAWLVGHTGTGKSTLVEQVCARTMTMFQRVNFDSDITRLEFVGKVDVVTNDDGAQVTSFTDGILPTAMQMPCVLMLDEADAIRGDIAYVLQPVLEGKSLRLLEDGGRMVHPHPEFSIVATANTVGSGDSTGMYSAAVKMQSTAAMNRYNVFINVDYMDVDDEMAMISQLVPSLSDEVSSNLSAFITQYRNAIRIGEVSKPISPRNTITIAQYATDFEGRIGYAAAFKRALERNLFNAMDEGERAIAVGIADRINAQ